MLWAGRRVPCAATCKCKIWINGDTKLFCPGFILKKGLFYFEEVVGGLFCR